MENKNKTINHMTKLSKDTIVTQEQHKQINLKEIQIKSKSG